jgi:hypothetical protein
MAARLHLKRTISPVVGDESAELQTFAAGSQEQVWTLHPRHSHERLLLPQHPLRELGPDLQSCVPHSNQAYSFEDNLLQRLGAEDLS